MPDQALRETLQGEAVHQIDVRVKLLPHLHIETLCGCGLAQWSVQRAFQTDPVLPDGI